MGLAPELSDSRHFEKVAKTDYLRVKPITVTQLTSDKEEDRKRRSEELEEGGACKREQ